MPSPSELVLLVVLMYALVGVVFSIWFVARGAGARDDVAKRAPLRVRLLFAPGAVAVWPALLAMRGRNREEASSDGP